MFKRALNLSPVRRIIQAILVVCLLFTCFLTAQTIHPKAAHAQSTDIYIAFDGVNLRAQPNTNSAILDKLGYYQGLDYICYTTGQNIYGTNLWFEVKDYNGRRGFYSSYYDSMPYSEWQQHRITVDYGIPPCLSLDVSTAWPATNSTYDRSAAVAWALAHAQDVQPFPSACTWFVSQALWAGGFSPDSSWNSEGYRSVLYQGTPTATAATLLTDYLYHRYLESSQWGVVNLTEERFKKNTVSEAVVGDIIAYDWSYYKDNESRSSDEKANLVGFVPSHLALVVSIAPGNYPLVAEWGTADIFFLGSGYTTRGWTWSNNDHTSLQNKESSKYVAAKLLHFPEPQP